MKFQMYYPLVTYYVNQAFGVNGQYYRDHGINIIGHNGVDLHADHGQPVYAAHDGIAYHEVDSNQGEGVVLITNESYDYKGGQCFFKSIYWHFCDPGKEPNFKSPVLDYQQKNGGKPLSVKAGDLIGYADSTGFSGGTHLHFGLKPIKPGLPLGNDQDAADVGIGNWVNLEPANGYLGAINPVPYFNGKFTKEITLSPADQVAVIATTEALKGNKKLSDQLWAIVALIKAFLVGQ